MLNRFSAILAIISTLLCINEAFKILITFPLVSPSHAILGNGYVEHLINAGHEVTYITPFPRKDPPPNLHQINIEYPESLMPTNFFTIENIIKKKADTNFSNVFPLFLEVTTFFLKSEGVQKLLNDPNQTFDVVITEWLFTDIYAGFAPVFQCPLIWSDCVDPHWMTLRLIDEAPNPAYTSDIMSNNVPPFTFTQRAQELWTQIKMTVLRTVLDKQLLSLYEDVFVAAGKRRGVIVPPLEEVKYNASFVLSNSHASLGEPTRLPQNFKPIGGYHIDLEPKPLPEGLKKIMDNAKHGVIYFSMGSNLKGKDISEDMKRGFLDTFSQIKQTVLWKFEETLSDPPENLHILNWAPQQSILAHPNCVLFITHGGLLSITETVHYGVPIIGIPAFGDQFINVDRAVSRGFAKRVDLSYNTPKEIKRAIQEIINNPSYHEKAKYLSTVYHDRPVAPGKELVHWVEHVIKTRGAPHFRSRALQLAWSQKMYLDLAALTVSVLFTIFFTLKCLFKLRTKITSRKKND